MRDHLRPTIGLAITALGLVISITASARAGDRCCAHCGCAVACQKICRLVCEEKKVETICWGCKPEDFCVPGPSKPGCRHSEMVCQSCVENGDSKEPFTQPKKFVWTEWIPSCSTKISTKKKLMKKVVTQKVPSYKWVVEELCEKCEANCVVAEIQPGVEIPTPPAVDAKLKYSQSEVAVPNVALK